MQIMFIMVIGLWLIIGINNLTDTKIGKFQFFCVWLCFMISLIANVVV